MACCVKFQTEREKKFDDFLKSTITNITILIALLGFCLVADFWHIFFKISSIQEMSEIAFSPIPAKTSKNIYLNVYAKPLEAVRSNFPFNKREACRSVSGAEQLTGRLCTPEQYPFAIFAAGAIFCHLKATPICRGFPSIDVASGCYA